MREPCHDGNRLQEVNGAGVGGNRRPAAARVGAGLKAIQSELQQAGGRLQSVLGADEIDLVSEGLRLLDAQTCRIAVIGQIKAGKSSFINALVQKHDLLPTDVNPWTTAVTNLNFGRPTVGTAATFQFFTGEEWERLAEAQGPLGELTERFVPGFERRLLKQHIAAVKIRAERRLGAHFGELLGQTHAFETITAEVLRRYVCAGNPAGIGDAESQTGQFSDVTKAAFLNLDGGPFDFPTTIIDTPGTNDPFLVRDEITRSCLDQADIYLVVLTARQPLSPSDLALLRILRGLHKEQIVVFINRVDELSNIRSERDAVIDYVRKRLQREFPGSNIPVITGSASWALMALTADVEGIEPAIDARSLAFFQEAGLIRRDELLRPASEGAERSRLLRAALFAGSGIPAVHSILDAMISQCRCTHVISQLIASFGEMSRVARDQSQIDLSTISRDFETSLHTAEQSNQELERLRAEMTRLDEVVSVIERSAYDFRQQLSGIVTSETSDLRGRLIAHVDHFSSDQAEALLQALKRGDEPRKWTCNTDHLRRLLAEDFVAGYRVAEQRINDLHEKVQVQLDRLMSLLTGQALQSQTFLNNQPRVAAPRMRALSNRLVLDLHFPWWRAWWSARPSPQQRGTELVELVRSDLFPLVDDLIDSCMRELEAMVESISKWTFGVSGSIVSSLRTQRERLLSHYENIRVGIDGKADPLSIAAKRTYIGDLQQRLHIADEVTRKLASLSSKLQSFVQRTPGDRP